MILIKDRVRLVIFRHAVLERVILGLVKITLLVAMAMNIVLFVALVDKQLIKIDVLSLKVRLKGLLLVI